MFYHMHYKTPDGNDVYLGMHEAADVLDAIRVAEELAKEQYEEFSPGDCYAVPADLYGKFGKSE